MSDFSKTTNDLAAIVVAAIAFFSMSVERLFEWRSHVADNEAARIAADAAIAGNAAAHASYLALLDAVGRCCR